MDDLHHRWLELLQKADQALVAQCWSELDQHYSETHRYYHNWEHIRALLEEYDKHASLIGDKTTVLLAIFYHDIVYQPGSGENETKSSQLAVERMQQLGFSSEATTKLSRYILATQQHHTVSGNDQDLLYFLDFDLSILAADRPLYLLYAEQVRMEFSAIPDGVFRAGRISFLQSLLHQDHLFFTGAYRSLEFKAKANIVFEMKMLGGA